MKLELKENEVRIIPETVQDIVYLEAVLGLRTAGEKAVAYRSSPYDLPSVFSYVAIRKPNVKEVS